MNPNQLHILQHSLGCDKHGIAEHRFPRDEEYYRNRYVSQADADLTALVEMGYMTMRPGSMLSGGIDCLIYHVTQTGIVAMKAESPASPKVSRSRQRYRDYLRADSSWSFGEWLRYGGYKPLRYERETA